MATPAADAMLVLGDLHLHPGAAPEVARDLARLLDAEARPGLLVLNGDVLDLDRVRAPVGTSLDPGRVTGRVRRTLDACPDLGASLGRWTARGGRVAWLPGNHDAEVCRPEVQVAIRAHLGLTPAQLAFPGERYRAGGMHIEHGHQHDPDNRFLPDTARAVSEGRLAAFPLGCLLTRNLLGHIPAFSNQGDNHRSPARVLLRVLREHGFGAVKMIALYFLAALQIAGLAWPGRRRVDAHTTAASTMASPASTMASPWLVLRRMYLDRLVLSCLLFAILFLGLAGALASASPPSSLLVGLLGLTCGGLLLRAPARRRAEFRHRDREGVHRAAAAAAADGARLVVLGHTHHAESRKLGATQYLNPGAFDAPAESGRPSYVRVDGRGARIESLEVIALTPGPERAGRLTTSRAA